jgi:hypothetical protein
MGSSMHNLYNIFKQELDQEQFKKVYIVKPQQPAFATSERLNSQIQTANATIFLSLYLVDFDAQRRRCCKNSLSLAWHAYKQLHRII